MMGEFHSFELEHLMNWINHNTNPNDAFVGPMPTMANVKLSTNRPIIIHPHYEDVALRNRTKYIYSYMYGLLSPEHFYNLVKYDFNATYVLIEEHFCLRYPTGKPHCAMREVSKVLLGTPRAVQSVCHAMLEQTERSRMYFEMVFKAGIINLYKVL